MAVTLEEVTKLYVATFNRAPDAAGITYWANSGMPIENIAQSFFDQSETQTLYPSGTANSSFVTSVYDNLFNRTPDTDGFNYWVQELNNGNISKQNFILAVINGALGDDATILTNKQTVGLDFVAKGLEDVTLARSVMADVDATQTSVNSALDLIDSGTTSPEIWGIRLISTSSTGELGNRDSTNPSISADGRYVTFQSDSYLAGWDANHNTDVFLKDTQTGAITLLSASPTESGNASSADPSISSDGRYVAFSSNASDLVAGDTNRAQDIFLKDTQTGAITVVSTSSTGILGSKSSSSSSISADGRYVAFSSLSSELIAGNTTSSIWDHRDIFLKDTQTGVLTEVSTSTVGGFFSAFSADGRYVAFSNDTIFLKDIQTGVLTAVSTSSTGVLGNGISDRPSISADGRYVAFESKASNLVSGDTNGTYDIFIKDTQTGAITLVSTSSSGEQGNGGSYNPSISADGRYVTFSSNASDLVTGDTNGYIDIFLKDTQTGAITVVSKSSTGVFGNANSLDPSISADGSYVTFYSSATNLVTGDTNGTSDIFLVGVNDLF